MVSTKLEKKKKRKEKKKNRAYKIKLKDEKQRQKKMINKTKNTRIENYTQHEWQLTII